MLGNGEMTRCLTRKSELLRASEVHRTALRRETGKLKPVMAWVDAGLQLAGSAGALRCDAKPLIGALRAPDEKSHGLLEKLVKGFALVRSVSTLWHHWRCAVQ